MAIHSSETEHRAGLAGLSRYRGSRTTKTRDRQVLSKGTVRHPIDA
jgi:hypothetical protein